MAKSDTFRNWSVLAYPESFSNAIDFLKEQHIQFVAILHNKDKKEDGTYKKPHWHIVIKSSGPLTEKTVRTRLGMPVDGKDDPNGFQRLQQVYDLKGAVRYLTHVDHPEKEQYNTSDLITTFDVSKYFTQDLPKITPIDIIDICLKNRITRFDGLCAYAYNARDQNLFEFIRCNTYFLKTMFTWDLELELEIHKHNEEDIDSIEQMFNDKAKSVSKEASNE